MIFLYAAQSETRGAHTSSKVEQPREKSTYFSQLPLIIKVSLHHHAGDRPQRRLPTISRRAQDRPTASAPRRSMILGGARRLALGGSRGMAAKALALALVLCALSLSDATVPSPSDGAYPDSACFSRTRGFA